MQDVLYNNKILLAFSSGEDCGNFGDLLSKWIVERLSGRDVIKYRHNPVEPHLCAIGSILSRNEICSPAVVWGAGFLSPQKAYKIHLTAIRQFIRGKYGKSKFCAVRGKKSREILLNAGFECPEVYGDPALLMPTLYTPKSFEKKYRVGIICHDSHEKLPQFLKSDLDGVKKILINRTYETITDFVDEVCSCEVILSSSLHGLIIAIAYGIPVVRLIVKGHSLHPNKSGEDRQNFKYDDFLSGFNSMSLEDGIVEYNFPCMTLNGNDDLTEDLVKKKYIYGEKPMFKWSADKLLKVFPYLREKII